MPNPWPGSRLPRLSSAFGTHETPKQKCLGWLPRQFARLTLCALPGPQTTLFNSKSTTRRRGWYRSGSLRRRRSYTQSAGFLNALASASHGGVMLRPDGSIRRDATLGLSSLRRLTTADENMTEKLRRYILGLALVALTAEQETSPAQGCNLVPAEEGKSRKFEIVHATGKRKPCKLTHDEAKRYAEAAASEFGVGINRDVAFDKKLAEKDIKGDEEKLKGEVVSLDPVEKKLKLNVGKKNKPIEIDVTTKETTNFFKGKEASHFEAVVVLGDKLDVELANGVAVKVSGKK